MSTTSVVSPNCLAVEDALHFPTTSVLKCDKDSITVPDYGSGTNIQCPETAIAIQLAASFIKTGCVVAFPTETVYGLGACATSSTAVSKIFSAKGRPSDNPLIVHVSSQEMLKSFLPPDWVLPNVYQALIERFWPGPLTILVPTTSPAQPTSPISNLVTCGLPTVAVRMPANLVARALLIESSVPIAAPSANQSGRPSPTTAQHVARDLEHKIQLILDGGPCQVGVESTVVDGLNPDGRLRILRLGGLSVEAIENCLLQAGMTQPDGQPALAGVHNRDFKDTALEAKPTTPGMKYKHYAPKASVIILEPISADSFTTHEKGSIPDVAQIVSELSSPSLLFSRRIEIGLMLVENSSLFDEFQTYATQEHPLIRFHHSDLGPADQPEISAQRLFSSLRHLDEQFDVDVILVERLSETGLGATVMERLKKASGHNPIRPVRVS